MNILLLLLQSLELHIYANKQELKQLEQFKYLGVTYDSLAIEETAINKTDQYRKNAD